MTAALDRALLEAWPLPIPAEGSKEERGSVCVAGGGRQMAGAVHLAGMAALRAGAGRLRIGTAASRIGPFATALPEAWAFGLPETSDGALSAEGADALLAEADHGDALLFGPGMSDGPDARSLLDAVLSRARPSLVLDAGALPGLMDGREAVRARDGRVVVTPHAGEMAKLLDRPREAIEGAPEAAAREAAEALQAVVVMKGAETTVVAPNGRAWRYRGGGVGLATSGSGDVLAGVIAGLLARGAEPPQAALWGVFLHGEAGAALAERIGPVGFLAREILEPIPGLLASFGRR